MKKLEFRPAASDVEQILAYRKLQALDGSADSKNKYAKSIIICAGEGNRSEAYVQIKEILRDAVSLEPDSVESNVNLATALGEVGKLDEAIAAFRTVLILQPGYEYAKFMLAHLLSEQVYFVTIISENCRLRISS